MIRYALNQAFVSRLAASMGALSGSDATNANTFALNQLNYALGTNPRARSYVVGIGNNAPRITHHRSAHDSTSNPPSETVPALDRHSLDGALLGGPNQANDNFLDDRTQWKLTEVATDYNALFTGLAASFAGQNCGIRSPPPPPPPPPPGPTPAPPAVQFANSYTVTVSSLQQFYMQLAISPRPARVVVLYNTDKTSELVVDVHGKWATSNLPFGFQSTSQIGIHIFTTATSTQPLYKMVKEGSLKLLISLKPAGASSHVLHGLEAAAASASFSGGSSGSGYSNPTFAPVAGGFNPMEDAESFLLAFAQSLNISRSRVGIDSISSDNTQVVVIVYPLPLEDYTLVNGTSDVTNAALLIALQNPASPQSASLTSTFGASASVSIVSYSGLPADSWVQQLPEGVRNASPLAMAVGVGVAAVVLFVLGITTGYCVMRRKMRQMKKVTQRDAIQNESEYNVCSQSTLPAEELISSQVNVGPAHSASSDEHATPLTTGE